MANAEELSKTLASVAAAAAATVVRVGAWRGRAASGVVWSDELIVTAHHSLGDLGDDDDVEIGLEGGEAIKATLVGRDPGTDVAVLRAEGTKLVLPRWTDKPDLALGHLVLALGRPGRALRASLGVVSALADGIRTRGGGRLDRYVESDTDLPAGWSGGLLVDVGGNAIGMNTAGLVRGAPIAVPAETLRRVVDSIASHGRVRRGYLGIGAYPVRLSPALADASGQARGLMLVAVEPGGPADRAGLLLGDVLLSLGDDRLAHMPDLFAALDESRIDQSVTAKVARAGQVEQRAISVGARP